MQNALKLPFVFYNFISRPNEYDRHFRQVTRIDKVPKLRMTQDSATSETTALVDASEYSPLLQTNSQDTATHANLGSINGTIQSLANTQNTNTGLIGPQSEDADDTGEDDKPLPKLQIFLLCYCRVVEPIAFFSIFPFINKMIEDTGGVREEDVGFYSGLIVRLTRVMLVPNSMPSCPHHSLPSVCL